MIEPLNPWLPSILKKAEKLYEDSDRVTHAARLFTATIKRVHRLATHSAIRCPEPWPDVERFQPDEGAPVLTLEWFDKSSSWCLCFSVRRGAGVKPFTSLEFYGVPDRYFTEQPTDGEITKALHDYFETWKREG